MSSQTDSKKPQGSGGGGGVGPSRRTWDVNEYTQRANQRDQNDRQLAIENEARRQKGLAPLRHRRDDLPEPTQLLQARNALDLSKNLGKAVIVTVDGQNGPGFYCEICRKLCKDNMGYLDHINGRVHLKRLGQTTQVERSTLQQVRAKIHSLRAQLSQDGSKKSKAMSYDFDARIRVIAEAEQKQKEERRLKRRQARNRKKQAATVTAVTATATATTATSATPHQPVDSDVDMQMMSAMGFAGFGSTKKA